MRLAFVAVLATTAYAGSAAEQKWRDEAEAVQVDEHKGHTPKLIAACGHDIEVKLDWKTLKQADWPTHKGIAYVGPQGTVSNVFYALEDLCADKAYKPKASKITKLVIHGAPCKGLPPYFPGDSKSGPGVKYKLSHGKLEEWICEESTTDKDGDAKHWLSGKL